MKQIVDKLNKIAKAIDSDVTISNRKLIIDSLDSITKAFGGTPNDSKLIVDKLEDIANYVHGGGGTYTETYQFIKGGTYTATSPNLTLEIGDNGTEIYPYSDVIVNVNGEDCLFVWQGNEWECAEKLYSISPNADYMYVEEPGTYTIAPCNITLTGNAVDLVMQPGSLYMLDHVVVDGKDYTYRFWTSSGSSTLERKLIIDGFFIMSTPM